MPPPAVGHWQRPSSRRKTSRRTAAGTWRGSPSSSSARVGWARGRFTSPLRFAARSRSRSMPASRISSTSAPGWECESACRAASSFSMNRLETVTWSRRRSAVMGSIVEGAGDALFASYEQARHKLTAAERGPSGALRLDAFRSVDPGVTSLVARPPGDVAGEKSREGQVPSNFLLAASSGSTRVVAVAQMISTDTPKYPCASTSRIPRTLRHDTSGARAVTSSGRFFAASPMISRFRITAARVRSSATNVSKVIPSTNRRIFAHASRMSSANCRQSRPCLADIDSLALDGGAHARLQGVRGHEVDLEAEPVLEEVLEPQEIIERGRLLEVDEDVEVAPLGGLVPCG